MLNAIWRYRFFLFSSIYRELAAQFIRSKLGGLWLILHPLAQVAIYALILSQVLSARLPELSNQYAYAIYLTAGLLAWNLFSEILVKSVNVFVSNGHLMKQVNFPRVTLPAIVVGSCIVNNLLLLFAVLAIFVVLGHGFTLALLWIPILMALVACLALGLGLILGVLNVFVRDIGQVVPVVLQITFWLTPIVYPLSILPAHYLPWLSLGPMYHITIAYQNVLVYGQPPDMSQLGWIVGVAVLSGIIGLVLFRRASPELVDVL